MGSRRTQGRRRERLSVAGLVAEELARLSGPAGLDLGGASVGEAALAVLAEAVAALHGRAGGRLSTSANAIHTGNRP
jgi:xanthine dehydrogenase accessory factor